MKKSIGSIALCALAGLAAAGDILTQTDGPDVTVCALYNLDQKQRSGELNGFSISTTSRNNGDENLDWFANPQENHPFIAYNLFRMNSRRCEQIGVSWIKHGFAATNFPDCPPVHGPCNGNFGSQLFPDCADTYGSGLNASLSYLGPRHEVNPWTGSFTYPGSLLDRQDPTSSSVDRLMIVHDDDLNPALNPGMNYYAEGYYVAHDDLKHMNSASYRPVGTPVFDPTPGGGNNYWTMSSPNVSPSVGFVFEEWGGNESVISATGSSPVEGVSTDGRAKMTSKVFDNGDGTWDYEYGIYNVDMFAQVTKVEFPIPANVNVTNIGFHAPSVYEDMNATSSDRGVPVSNDPWTSTLANGKLTYATINNPIRWGTMYNFRFTTDTPPQTGPIDVTPFFGGGVYTTMNNIPTPGMMSTCNYDINNTGTVDIVDFTAFSMAFGTSTGDPDYDPALDYNNTGSIDIVDFTEFASEFGRDDC